MNGITFDNTTPLLEGSWVNPRTGDRITIRDSFFSDNEYVITTVDGRTLNYRDLERYIRDDAHTIKGPVRNDSKQQRSADVIKPADNYQDLIMDDDLALVGAYDSVAGDTTNMRGDRAPQTTFQGKNTDNRGASESNEVTLSSDTVSHKIIHRILADKNMPELSVKVSWKAPSEELSVLTGMLGISEEEIADYCLSRIDSTPDWASAIREHIIRSLSSSDKCTVKEDTEKVTPKDKVAPKKQSSKKSKK